MPAAPLQPRAALSSHGWLSVTKEQGPVQSQPFLRPYAHCLGSHTASCPSVLRVKASAQPGQRKVPGAAAPKQPGLGSCLQGAGQLLAAVHPGRLHIGTCTEHVPRGCETHSEGSRKKRRKRWGAHVYADRHQLMFQPKQSTDGCPGTCIGVVRMARPSEARAGTGALVCHQWWDFCPPTDIKMTQKHKSASHCSPAPQGPAHGCPRDFKRTP